jgi:HemY protein
MKRFLVPLVAALSVLVVLCAFVLWGEHGRASVEWLGWRADTTASLAVGATLVSALLIAAALAGIVWLARLPTRFSRARQTAAAKGRLEAITRGFAALAAGDAAEARRQSARAMEALPSDSPSAALARMLAARAADAVDDRPGAILAYEALLAAPETAPAGRRGLADLARRMGDREAELRHAEAAYAAGAGVAASWAWRTLFEARLKAGDVAGAGALIDTAEKRKTLAPAEAAKVRAALVGAPGAAADRSRLDEALAAAENAPGPAADDDPLILPPRQGGPRWRTGL